MTEDQFNKLLQFVEPGMQLDVLLGVAIIVVSDQDPVMEGIPLAKAKVDGKCMFVRLSLWNQIIATAIREWVDTPAHVISDAGKRDRAHVMSETCWCHPDVERPNPQGPKVIIHRVLQ